LRLQDFFEKRKTLSRKNGANFDSTWQSPEKKFHAKRRAGRLLRLFNRGPPSRTQKQNSLERGAAKKSVLTRSEAPRVGRRMSLAAIASIIAAGENIEGGSLLN
jgi:hypothetical protein